MKDKETIDNLLKPRFKCIADYPDTVFKVGEVLVEGEIDLTEAAKYPHLFKKLEWWEHRTLDEMLSINYVKITEYTGYWRVGDVVNVTDYKVDTKNKKLEMYILNGTQQSIPQRCMPATFEEYNADKIKRRSGK